MVKVIWHNAASPPHMDDSIVFTRWHQCGPPSNNNASWDPPESTTQTAPRLVQPFCMAHDRDRQTDIPRYFVCNSRPQLLAQVVLRCDLKSGMDKRPSKVKGKVWWKASHPIPVRAVCSTWRENCRQFKQVNKRPLLPRDVMLARYMRSRVCVCLLQVGVLLKWLNVGSRKQRHSIAHGL